MATSETDGLPVAPPSLRLDGKAVWITGAGRGIGRALAVTLVAALRGSPAR